MISQELLLDNLKKRVVVDRNLFINPDFIETNSALILFAGNKAFKILKESKRGIDCSTILVRRTLLEEEMEINSEICSDLYFDIKPVFLHQGEITIGSKSTIGTKIEYTLCMKKLDHNSLVYNMLVGGVYSTKCSILIAQKLTDFHMTKLSGRFTRNDQSLIKKFGTVESFYEVVEKDFAMFEEMKASFIPVVVTKERYQEIKRYILRFLKKEKDLFAERVKLGYVLPIHGDFHSRNIFIEDGVVYAIDRSLRRNMRVSDILKDLAYLAIDLEMFGLEKQKEILFVEYSSKIKDICLRQLLPFYMCRRAFVAGMVNLFEEEKHHLKAYFDIAYKYAVNN